MKFSKLPKNKTTRKNMSIFLPHCCLELNFVKWQHNKLCFKVSAGHAVVWIISSVWLLSCLCMNFQFCILLFFLDNIQFIEEKTDILKLFKFRLQLHRPVFAMFFFFLKEAIEVCSKQILDLVFLTQNFKTALSNSKQFL